MKQVLQDIRSGEIAVHELPEPAPVPGFALVRVAPGAEQRAFATKGSCSKAEGRHFEARTPEKPIFHAGTPM